MVSMNQVDDRTFRVNFSADGLAKLQERIDSKLKEFLGDYADDSLVEYVLVLITNGKHKKEAKSELDVFLGDDSDTFVSWLWDHLTSNLDQYAQSEKPDPDETLKPKATSVELDETNISCHPHSDKQAELDEAFKKRHNRKWRTLTTGNESQQPFLCSPMVGEVEHERKASLSVCHTKQSVSPIPPSKRKRGRDNEHENMIEHKRPKPTIGALSRLFQSAVRDAVATTRPSSSLKEAGAKRLRCVVSTPNGDSALKGRPHRIQPNTEEEAAEDAVKVKSTKNNELNHGVCASESAEEVASVRCSAAPDEYDDYYHRMEKIQQMDYYHLQVDDHQVNHGVGASESAEEMALFRHNAVHDEYDDYYRRMEELQRMGYHHPQMDELQVDYYHNLEKSLQMHVEQRDYSSKYKENTNMQWNDTGLASGFVSDYQGYDNFNVINDRRMDVTQSGSSRGRKRDDSLMVQSNMAQKVDQVSHMAQLKDPPVSAPSASRKILNISVNVNTWKPPHFQPAADATELDIRRSLQQNEVGVGKSSVRLMKENKNSLAPNGNRKIAIQRLNETQKNTTSGPGLYYTGHSLEDADARTIVLNNVHFAATKDSLSRHFNRFGQVLKVFILTDVATGQPKGSAYVEFVCKEAAENALSLDGASFMSRILQVAKKSSEHQESTPTRRCPRVPQGSPLAAARFSRAPFPRVFPGAYRAQPPAKPRAKSLQWKRDTQPSVTGRGLTYIRKT